VEEETNEERCKGRKGGILKYKKGDMKLKLRKKKVNLSP
jgi:hypothetical protein